MIGNPKWFKPRKFGWGLGIGTNESKLYVMGVIIAVAAVLLLLPTPLEIRLMLTGLIVLIVVLDMLHMMMEVYKRLDEREIKHQAIAERNASFVAVIGLVAWMAYNSLSTYPIRPSFEQMAMPIGILIAMAFSKGITLLYLERAG